MSVLVLILLVVIKLAAIFGWIWLLLGIGRQGWRRIAGIFALQFSLVAIVFGLVNGHGLGAILDVLTVPLAYLAWPYYSQFAEFLSALWPRSVGVGVAVLMLLLLIPRLRLWSLAPALLAALVTAIVTGERVGQLEMCRQAAHFGVNSFPRNTFLWSLANTPDEFQFEIHATFEKDGRRYGWSYREMAWYVIPSDAWGDVNAPLFVCGAR